ncbi:chemotaxis protein CheA [Jannaschia sp. 2305UL9-9]|uniref:chemotaxis protein CheA n=1 Tax=Jannaschia sp. 2305UL9-9 TaxID=3121638 RepID=UPI003528012A
MSGMEEIKATFFEECTELLEQLEAGLLTLQAGDQNDDTVDAVFRAVHSIKGGAGAFDLGQLVGFSHEFETVLDGLRTDRLAPTPDVIAVLLRASDRLGDLVAHSRTGTIDTGDIPADLIALRDQLGDASGPPGGNEFDLDLGFAPIPLDLDLAEPLEVGPGGQEAVAALPGEGPIHSAKADAGNSATNTGWLLTFDPLPDLLESGNEPLFLFRSLQVLGQIRCEIDDGDLPPLTSMDAIIPRVRWRILLAPTAEDLTETEIESVFEFADDLCVLNIRCATDDDLRYFAGHSEHVVDETVKKEPPAEPDLSSAAPPADAPVSDPPAAQPVPDTGPKGSLAATIRVDLERIDRLVNLVGELVISQSMLAQSIVRDGLDTNSDSASGIDGLQQLTRDIQDSVMAIRAQPVRSLFQRMTRIVREAAQTTGKSVRMETVGETTEIDKTVVERLADPLTHMIRNAIDHGLESPAARAAVGKPGTGIVRLSARQQSDRVVIEVSDDGAGIDRGRVLARAIERELIPRDADLAPHEIDRLLFLPGFSTATDVSSLSGRGVGMDVVQRAIRDLNGTISVSSEQGVGCTISISLPLTLAILDGMIVRTSRQRMVIPLSAIVETQTVSAARTEMLGPRRQVALLHDRFVPIIDLATGMGFESTVAHCPAADEDDRALLFVQPDDLGPFAVQVDAIEAQRQVVIKGLGDSFGRIPGVSAATILGDGHVALIVDPSGLAATAGLAAGSLQMSQEVRAQ